MKVYKLEDLKESRLFYDKKPPSFLFIFCILILTLTIAFIAWSIFATKEEKYNFVGEVVAIQKDYFSVGSPRAIYAIHVKEGQFVSKGQPIMSFNFEEVDTEIKAIKEQKKILKSKSQLFLRAKKDLQNNNNTFNSKDSSEAVFYSEIQSLNAKIEEYKVDEVMLKKEKVPKSDIKKYYKLYEMKKNQLIQDLYVQWGEKQLQLEDEMKKLSIQEHLLSDRKKEFSIKAKFDGVIHFTADLHEGLLVQPGQAIGTLVSRKEGNRIETQIPVQDIGYFKKKISVKSTIIDSSEVKEYSNIQGRVTQIASDTDINSKGESFLRVWIDIENTKNMTIRNGMSLTNEIIISKKSYFDFFKEKLGI
ncbi:HlyD family secretion protein [Exiguobacterium sp. OS-77]|uniref:HlyD family secretion protein n=1 Tax=Exiguobacterium sp. OS-77 TaxID=1241306 RepID=UPI00040612D2|nr:HlyD family efflux transporter periplasmic adaptor subunit [Exiguobacterium sp. OS-77]